MVSESALVKSVPLNSIDPPAIATPRGSKPRIDSAVRVFPDPLSPTTPTASPGIISKETLLTRLRGSCTVEIPRLLTDKSGLLMNFSELDQEHHVSHRQLS